MSRARFNTPPTMTRRAAGRLHAQRAKARRATAAGIIALATMLALVVAAQANAASTPLDGSIVERVEVFFF